MENTKRTAKREKLVVKARNIGGHIDTEGGTLCADCAAVLVADSEYQWLAVVVGGTCYNCAEAQVSK